MLPVPEAYNTSAKIVKLVIPVNPMKPVNLVKLMNILEQGTQVITENM